MSQTEDHLDQLQQQIKISDSCSDDERHQLLLDYLLEQHEVFVLSDDKLGETDIIEHSIDTTVENQLKNHQDGCLMH